MANTRRSNLNQAGIRRDGEEASVTAPNETQNAGARPIQRPPRAPSQQNEYDEGHEILRVVDDVNANVNRNGSNGRADSIAHSRSRAGSSRSQNSAARIEALEEELRERDAMIDEMRQAMIAGGLLPNRNFVNRRREDEAESDLNRYEDGLENHTRRHNNRVGSTFETFMKCKPPTFKGSTDPQVCFQWFLKMDQTFDSGVFTEAQRVSYAIRMLEGSALQWWNSVSRTLSASVRASLTWEAFSNKVKTKYCSRGAIQRIERDFLNLKKGNMNIDQYNTAFTEKLQFANKLCPDEESKVARYVEGLPYEYRTSVRSKTTLEAAMEESKFIEDDIAIKNQELGKVGEKRKSEGHTGSSKMFKGNSNNKKYDNNNEEKKCVECNSRHTGECTLETRRCFRCGKKGHVGQDCTSKEPICYSCKEMGHISTNCPNRKVGGASGTNTKKDDLPRPKARAFHMTAEEEKVGNESGGADETYAMYANRA